MIYYVKDNDLYSTDIPVGGEGFVEITETEYHERLSASIENREQGTPVTDSNDDFVIDFNDVTESDYISALEDFGVKFNG